jgi:hypothetical protein
LLCLPVFRYLSHILLSFLPHYFLNVSLSFHFHAIYLSLLYFVSLFLSLSFFLSTLLSASPLCFSLCHFFVSCPLFLLSFPVSHFNLSL